MTRQMQLTSTHLNDDTLGDAPEILKTIAALTELKIFYRRPTQYQIKIGNLSFYPAKGTIFRDGDIRALPQRGLPAFLLLVEDLKTNLKNKIERDNAVLIIPEERY